MVRNRYSRLLLTSEDRLCVILCVQEQSTNMTSKCQCIALTWRPRSTWWRHNAKSAKKRPWRQLRNQWSMIFLAVLCIQGIKQRLIDNILIRSLVMWFTNGFQNHWQITSLLTEESLFTETHALFYICILPLVHIIDCLRLFKESILSISNHVICWTRIRHIRSDFAPKHILKHDNIKMRKIVAPSPSLINAPRNTDHIYISLFQCDSQDIHQ